MATSRSDPSEAVPSGGAGAPPGTAQHARPVLSVRGQPTAVELAALVAVLGGLASPMATQAPMAAQARTPSATGSSAWVGRERILGRVLGRLVWSTWEADA